MKKVVASIVIEWSLVGSGSEAVDMSAVATTGKVFRGSHGLPQSVEAEVQYRFNLQSV